MPLTCDQCRIPFGAGGYTKKRYCSRVCQVIAYNNRRRKRQS